jgi:hypothetical protein
MPVRRWRESIACAAALAPLTFAAAAPAADTKSACVAASLDGQTLRKADKLLEARDRFRSCAASTCPDLVRARCTQWLKELEPEIPTVIVRAKDSAGTDILEIDITIDGRASTAGRQESLDPGEHVVVVTRPDGHAKEEKFLLVDGEQARVLTLHLGVAPPASPPPEGTAAPPARGGLPAGTWVLGGLSLAAFGAAAFFYVQASDDLSQLQKTCSPRCSSSQTQPVYVNADLSYVSIGVGVVALGGAIAWALLDAPQRPAQPAALAPAFDVRPLPGGALSTVGFLF